MNELNHDELMDRLGQANMRLEWRDPHTLAPRPENPKKHTTLQRKAFEEFVEEVGWLAPLLYNERTQTLLDGHLRHDYAIEHNVDRVPVMIVDVPAEREPDILVLFDSVGQLYQMDRSRLELLIDLSNTQSEMLRTLMMSIGTDGRPSDDLLAQAAAEESDADLADEEERGPLDPNTLPNGGISMVLGEQYNYVVLLFRNAFDWVAAQDHFDLRVQQCAFHSKPTRGIGRVIDGSAYLTRIMRELRPDDDAEPEEESDADPDA